MTDDYLPPDDPQIVELRQYTLHPRQRDVLIELFDREFIESQEREGMRVMGQFRDLDDPDRFVWLRGFADMASRARGLQGFYDGPTWAAHRDAANATMVDSDDVLLLRPAWRGAGLAVDPERRAAPAGLVDVTVFSLREEADPNLLALCREHMAPARRRAGALAQGWYIPEPSPNNFPRLPVREGEHVLVGVAVFEDQASHDAFLADGSWQRDVAPALAQWLAAKPQVLRLAPTARSAIHA
jgi:quinol monooxygenase YgiN